MLKLGSTDIGKMYFGTTEIAKAYLGSDLVFDSSGGNLEPLPNDAVRIQYLESSGTQYIATAIPISSTIKVETKAQFLDTNGCTLVGAYTSNTLYFGIVVGLQAQSSGGKLYARIGSGSITSNATPTGLHTFTTWLSRGNTYFDVDGTTVHATTPSYTNFPIYLFARNNSGTAGSFASARMYYCKIWDGANLIFDAIPVRIGQVGYMYDMVSEQFFGNDGTGDFILGNDK